MNQEKEIDIDIIFVSKNYLIIIIMKKSMNQCPLLNANKYKPIMIK